MTRTPLAMMVGWLALTAALVSLGCASKEQVAGGQPAGLPARVEAPPGKDDGGSPAKQETAPPVVTAPNRREAASPDVKAPKAPAAPVPSPSKPAATPALDLKSLEKRLRETTAIGVFTKLALKNPSVSPGEGWNHPRRTPAIVRPAHDEGPLSAAGQRCSTGSRHRGVARSDLEPARRSRQVFDGSPELGGASL